jgi:hypothetical protein
MIMKPNIVSYVRRKKMSETAIVNQEVQPMTVAEMSSQVRLVQEMMQGVMKQGTHYGIIKGCGNKPTLLKPGAEKLCMTFRLAPTYEVTRDDLPNGHREYAVVCTLSHITTGNVWSQGVGCCSSMESKYRYRNSWESGKKIKKETEDPADQFNTVLKMAKKRAHIDAVLTATSASDIFTQDIEDYPQVEPAVDKPRTSAPEPVTAKRGVAESVTTVDDIPYHPVPVAEVAIAVAEEVIAEEKAEAVLTLLQRKALAKQADKFGVTATMATTCIKSHGYASSKDIPQKRLGFFKSEFQRLGQEKGEPTHV